MGLEEASVAMETIAEHFKNRSWLECLKKKKEMDKVWQQGLPFQSLLSWTQMGTAAQEPACSK